MPIHTTMKKLTTLITTSTLLCVGAEAALVAHYEFEDIPNLLTDSSSSGHDLISGGSDGAALGTGKVGSGSLRLSGDSWAGTPDTDDAATISPLVPLTSGGDFSISLWLKVETVTSASNTRYILSTRNTEGFALYLVGDGEIRYTRYSGGGGTLNTGTEVVADTWIHIGFTFDDSTDLTQFYINGVAGPSRTMADGTNNVSTGAGFGSRHHAGVDLLAQSDANLDDVGAWDHKLSAAEMNTVFTSGVASIAVPEPTTTSLLGLGALAMLNRRRRA